MTKALTHPLLSSLREMTEGFPGRFVLIKSDGSGWDIIRDPFNGTLLEIEPAEGKTKIVCTADDVVEKVYHYFFDDGYVYEAIKGFCSGAELGSATALLQNIKEQIEDIEEKCDLFGTTAYVMDDSVMQLAYVITEDTAQFEYEGVKIYIAFIIEKQ